MKVAGSAGVGQYYRHAIAQAVLYREFIKRATLMTAWPLPSPAAATAGASAG